MEKYLDYAINVRDVSNSQFKIVLEAIVAPDLEILYNFLWEKNIIDTKWTDFVKYAERSHRLYDDQKVIPSDEDLQVFHFLVEFCKQHTHKYVESARIFLDLNLNPNPLIVNHPISTNRALKKIKKHIQELPQPRVELARILNL